MNEIVNEIKETIKQMFYEHEREVQMHGKNAKSFYEYIRNYDFHNVTNMIKLDLFTDEDLQNEIDNRKKVTK